MNPEQARELIGRFLPPVYVVREGEEVSLVENRALLVVGPRQSDKSTMIWHRLRDFTPRILFLNMEDPLLKMACITALGLVRPFLPGITIP